MKTGHTETAGFCLVGSAKRDNHRLISVLFGADSDRLRASESQKLLNFGFQNFDHLRLYQKDQPVARRYASGKVPTATLKSASAAICF